MARSIQYRWRSLLPGCCCGGGSRSSSADRFPSSRWLSFFEVSGELTPEEFSQSLAAGTDLYMFTLQELKVITKNFSMANFLGEGGFGPVFKGLIGSGTKPGLNVKEVAVKLLDLEGPQGHKEWLAEVIFLGQLRHPNLVRLIGYCIQDRQRMLVYEFMANGSLENHLFKFRFGETLPWSTRLKIAVGAAKGLSFLHEAENSVIYRDFKASNILLDSENEAKLSDFGLAKDGPKGDQTHVSTQVMGTQGYAAPEYIRTGHLTTRSDVYSFGVVLLELLTGRRCVDKLRPTREQDLVEWMRPCLGDHRKLNRIIDPTLGWRYSTIAVEKVALLAYQCLSHRPKSRPPMSAVVETLEPLLELDDMPFKPFVYVAPPSPEEELEDKLQRPRQQLLRSKMLVDRVIIEKRLYRAQLSTRRLVYTP